MLIGMKSEASLLDMMWRSHYGEQVSLDDALRLIKQTINSMTLEVCAVVGTYLLRVKSETVFEVFLG